LSIKQLLSPTKDKGWGIFLILIALFFGVSFATYHYGDPSFNRATNADVVNLAGAVGAYIADPILQFLGLSALFLVVMPLSWGGHLLVDGEMKLIWLRVISLSVVIASFSAVVSSISIKESWLFINYGGFLGYIEKKQLLTYVNTELYLSSSLVIFLASFYFSFGLSNARWVGFFGEVSRLVVTVYNALIFTVYLILYPIRLVIRLVRGEEASSEKVWDKLTKKTKNKKKATKARAAIKAYKASGGFTLPAVELFNTILNQRKSTMSAAMMKKNTEDLAQVLTDFGIKGDIIDVHVGPVVTLYELEPAAGTKSSRVIGLSNDISRSMKSHAARIAVMPGRNALGIELPNKDREVVYLREMLESKEYKFIGHDLPIILGKDISGAPIIVDLAKMPHLLIAGTTGSGKSVAINTMILSLLYSLSPEKCKLIMIDPKMLELSVYDDIPHLLAPVVTEPSKAITALKWVVKEMENRYKLMSTLGVRNVKNYNERIEAASVKGETLERKVQTGFNPDTGGPIYETIPIEMTKLPFIVVIVDEMADLMLVAGKDIETSIQRLSQMARAAGIHIIMATQRPSVDVITGVIKANFPTRISFQVTSKIDSRTILGEQGAEQLLGKGDMLYMSGGGKIKRVHGPFVGDDEVESVVSYLKAQGSPNYVDNVTADDEDAGFAEDSDEYDELYEQAKVIVARERKASTSYIQRCLKIGYNRAATIIDRMEKEGHISPANHVGKREVLMAE
jgi:DNA segregation ATPase FtsK/SpoIIIE, S-DNA-T family